MILPLFYYDDSVLRTKAQPISEITDEIKQFAQDMVDSMIHYNGVGLAAPQVGKLLRLFVIRDEFLDENDSYAFGPPEIFINPVLSAPSSETVVMPEGCLSLPGFHADVVRPASIHVRYQTVDGHTRTEEVSGFRARVMMHENDHLNGVLFIDRMSSGMRKRLEPQLRAIKQKYHKQGV